MDSKKIHIKLKKKSPPKLELHKENIKSPTNPPLNLGYACINMTLGQLPSKANRVCVNRSCIASTFTKKGANYASELVKSNLESVINVLEWNHDNYIQLYRLSSDMFPHMTNPDFIQSDQAYAYPIEQFHEHFSRIGELAKRFNQRLTFHPGQFNQIGTPTRKVFEKTITDLRLQADVLDAMGLDLNSVMVVHGGGVYGDRPKTMERWKRQFFQLPEQVQRRIVIENCERSYSPLHMLELSQAINRPVVFDTHHHNCYHEQVEHLPDPDDFLDDILATWTRLDLTPKFHISEQDPAKRVGAHSKYVEVIPDYLLTRIRRGVKIDLMIEAKAKQLAVQRLYSKYGRLFNGQWYLH